MDLRDAESSPSILTATAHVATEAPGRYAKQLISHLGRRLTWHTQGDTSWTAVGDGSATVVVGTGVLTLRAEAPDLDTLARIQDVLGRHLERFGRRSELTVAWHPMNSEPYGMEMSHVG